MIITGYWTTKQLCQRFKISRRTIIRWMTRTDKPFPQPRMRGVGNNNRWAIEDVIAWEPQSQ